MIAGACSHPCGGHCCRDFTLPIGPLELAHQAKRAAISKKPRWTDVEQVAGMVIFLREDRSGPTRHYRGWRKRRADVQPEHVYHYTCRNLDRATGLCRIYETRPKLCREYPYGHQCAYRRCDAAGARFVALLPAPAT